MVICEWHIHSNEMAQKCYVTKSRETFVWVFEVCQDQIMLNKFQLVITLIQCLKQILVMEMRLEYYSENMAIFPNFGHFWLAGQTVVIES